MYTNDIITSMSLSLSINNKLSTNTTHIHTCFHQYIVDKSIEEKMEIIRSLMKMGMLILFVEWIFVWIMISTKLYDDNWTPKLTKYLNTTYFGSQGI